VLGSYATTIDITPTEPVPLAGRGGRNSPFVSVSDGLEANILLMHGEVGFVFLISIDTLFASDALKSAVQSLLPDELRNKIEDLLFIASHTHNGPALDPSKPVLGIVDDKYASAVASRIASALERLVSSPSKKTKRVTVGSHSCFEAVSRRKQSLRLSGNWPFISIRNTIRPNLKADIKRDLDVLVGLDGTGKVHWLIWLWTCHATATYLNRSVTADFPGEVRRRLREEFNNPELAVLYLPGFCGDIRNNPPTGRARLSAFLTTPFARPFYDTSKASFDKLCSSVTSALTTAVGKAVKMTVNEKVRLRHASIELSSLMTTQFGGKLEAVSLNIGEISFVLIGAEVCSPYVRKIEALTEKPVWLSGYLNQVQCYLPDNQQIVEGGYEVEGFFTSFAHSGPFGNKVEQHVLSLAKVLLKGSD
jgi:hypothetical protein